MNGWLGGLHIHGLDRGETPTADYLCTRCGAHKRTTGRDDVKAFVATDPAADHATRCRPPGPNPTPSQREEAMHTDDDSSWAGETPA